MKKLVKEAGISILVSITAGNSTPDMIIETAKLLSSSAFDRDLEIQADLKAAHYLKKSNIDPQPFSNFLFRLYKKENETLKYLTWISTHPESKERAEYLNEYITNKKCTYKSVLSKESWRILKDNL